MNVILYVLDSLRADHLSCYGYSRPASPNIDAIVEDGVCFENAFSQTTWTRPSAASILTSTYPSTNGLIRRADSLSTNVQILPEVLNKHGFNTLAISTIGQISSDFGFARAFEQFIELYKEEELFSKRQTTTTTEQRLNNKQNHKIVLPLGEDINNYLFPWVYEHKDRHNFIFLWSIDTHDPYVPPKGFDKFLDSHYHGKIDGSGDSIKRARSAEDVQRLINLYDCEILYADYCIGELVKYLKEMELYDDTMLIITSDHGEAFHDHHGNISHTYIPYEELIHVPLIIKFPGSEHRGTRVSKLVELIDIMPTVLTIGEINDNSLNQSVQGKNLLPTLTGKPTHDYVYSETSPMEIQDSYFSVRSQDWKYIRIESPQLGLREKLKNYKKVLSNTVFFREIIIHPFYYLRKKRGAEPEILLNLQKDQKEQINVKDYHPDVLEDFRKSLIQWHKENKKLAENLALYDNNMEKSRLDVKTEQQLRGLGYID